MKKIELSRLEKPARYLGGESNACRKDPSKVALRVCLAFPDLYEIGMSHLGHQIIYDVLNDRDDVYAERVYAPWIDAIKAMRETNTPLASLETKTPLADFDLIGFTIAYELAATNVLEMIDLGQVEVLAADRKDGDPIIVGGGPCTLNPEPWVDFFDAFLLGEGEQAAGEIAQALIDTKGKSREEKLRALSFVPGVYVPSLMTVEYNENGTIRSISGEPDTLPRRRILPDLNTSPYPKNVIAPNVRTVHERLAVEVARGCSRGCRFCHAGYTYRPVRERNPEVVAKMIEKGLAGTGFDDVSLLSLSTGDYSCINGLLSALIRSKAPKRISVSLPSLRAESLTGDIMTQIGKVKRTGFTLAPEAGTDRLRGVLNKGFTNEELFQTIRTVFENGWELVKLYFMIGLPTETLTDVEAIVDVTHEALRIGKSINKRARINVNVATFVPKPHTPFQWAPQLSMSEAERRLNRVKDKMMRRGVNLKWQATRMSVLEGVIARGNRETGKAIYSGWKHRLLFDAWTEQYHLDQWEKAFEDVGHDLYAEATWTPPMEGRLPWEIIDAAVSREFLEQEYERAMESEFTPDCRNDACEDCGACGDEIDVRLAEDSGEGRLFRRSSAPIQGNINFRYRLRYSKTGELRYLGHLDLSSVFQRAFRRAKLPLAFTQGFSPAPKISFAPPLPLGIESLDEYVDIHLAESIGKDDLLASILPKYLPEGLKVLEVFPMPSKGKSLQQLISGSSYLVSFSEFPDVVTKLDELIEKFNSVDTMLITLKKKKKEKTIDLVRLVHNLKKMTDDTIAFNLLTPPEGGIGPLAAISNIFGLDEYQVMSVRFMKQKTLFRGDKF